MTARCALVFGGQGALGAAVSGGLARAGASVVRTTRRCSSNSHDDLIAVDPFDPSGHGMAALDDVDPLDAVVWAQGANAEDSVAALDWQVHMEVVQANCLFVTATLARLLRGGRLRRGARLCIVSSIWQAVARQDRFSYAVSKAALAGIVRSAATDLASQRMLVNAVLPGVTDTPMARTMLTSDQLEHFEAATGFGRLVALDDIVSLVTYLCSETNTGVTGQSIPVDLGYSCVRLV